MHIVQLLMSPRESAAPSEGNKAGKGRSVNKVEQVNGTYLIRVSMTDIFGGYIAEES